MRTAVLTLAAALSLAACGGSSSGGSTVPAGSTSPGATTQPAGGATAPADPKAAKAEITHVWTTFFHTGTNRAEAVNLLEDGATLGKALDKAEQEDQQTGLVRRAKVQFIKFLTPTTANVTWTLLNKSNPVLPNASGQAVLVDGKWKVSKLTFCTLVELGNNGKPVPGCSP